MLVLMDKSVEDGKHSETEPKNGKERIKEEFNSGTEAEPPTKCGICGDPHYYRDCNYVVINSKVSMCFKVLYITITGNNLRYHCRLQLGFNLFYLNWVKSKKDFPGKTMLYYSVLNYFISKESNYLNFYRNFLKFSTPNQLYPTI